MSTAAVVKESLKEVLVGTEEEPQLSQQTRLDFMRHAVKDEGSDDYYMNEEQFISAVAPETEDYVCDLSIIFFLSTTSPSASATAQSTFSSLSLKDLLAAFSRLSSAKRRSTYASSYICVLVNPRVIVHGRLLPYSE